MISAAVAAIKTSQPATTTGFSHGQFDLNILRQSQAWKNVSLINYLGHWQWIITRL